MGASASVESAIPAPLVQSFSENVGQVDQDVALASAEEVLQRFEQAAAESQLPQFLNVRVISARGLRDADGRTTSDPYVLVKVRQVPVCDFAILS